MGKNPTGENTAEVTRSLCPTSFTWCVFPPVEVSQRCGEGSSNVVRIELPSGEKTPICVCMGGLTVCSGEQSPVGATICLHSPVEVAQTLAVLSEYVMRTEDPSGEKIAK